MFSRNKAAGAEEHLGRASAYCDAGNYGAAIKEIGAALEKYPVKEKNGPENMPPSAVQFFTAAYFLLGSSYSRIAKDLDKNDPAYSGLWETALKQYERVLVYKPNDPEVYNNLGACWWFLGDNEKAVKYRNKALDYNTEYPESYVNIGHGYMEKGRAEGNKDWFERAVQVFTNAVNIRNDYAEAYYSRAQAHGDLQNFAPAIADYDRAISLLAEKIKKMKNSGGGGMTHLEAEEYEQALELLHRSYFECGLLYLIKGNDKKAMAYFLNAVTCGKNDKTLALSYNFLAVSLARTGHKEQAAANFKKALDLDPGLANAQNNIKFMETGPGRFI